MANHNKFINYKSIIILIMFASLVFKIQQELLTIDRHIIEIVSILKI